MTVAFVLSGGASLGAIQVGMLAALEDAGIAPDLVVGTSVGALNGSWVASGRPVRGLADVWCSLERSDLFPLDPLVGLRGFTGRSTHFISDRGVRSVLRQHLGFERLEDAPLPFRVVACDARSGDEVVLQRGSAVEAILASSALPGIYPPVSIDGRLLIDGGIVNNTPISLAVQAGATDVWVLSTGYACGLPSAPTGAINMALHAVGLLVQQRLANEVSNRRYPVPVHLVPPPCPVDATATDFSRTGELIERAHRGTAQWLANGRPNAMPLHPHHQTY
ncbi:MAG: patatin-like phospholipase family protein [Actinomycetota bacterium]